MRLLCLQICFFILLFHLPTVSASFDLRRLTTDPLFAGAVVAVSWDTTDTLPTGQRFLLRTRVLTSDGLHQPGDLTNLVDLAVGSTQGNNFFVFENPGDFQFEAAIEDSTESNTTLVATTPAFHVNPPFSSSSAITTTSASSTPPSTISLSLSSSDSSSTTTSSGTVALQLPTSSLASTPTGTSQSSLPTVSHIPAITTSKTLSTQQVAGIAVGCCFAGLFIIGCLVAFCVRFQRRRLVRVEEDAIIQATPYPTASFAATSSVGAYETPSRSGHGFRARPGGTDDKLNAAYDAYYGTKDQRPPLTAASSLQTLRQSSTTQHSTASLLPNRLDDTRQLDGTNPISTSSTSQAASGSGSLSPVAAGAGRNIERDAFVQNLISEVQDLREQVRILEVPPPSYVTDAGGSERGSIYGRPLPIPTNPAVEQWRDGVR